MVDETLEMKSVIELVTSKVKYQARDLKDKEVKRLADLKARPIWERLHVLIRQRVLWNVDSEVEEESAPAFTRRGPSTFTQKKRWSLICGE